jgi:prepilin-type N-terminal cleavage/methylation domain-containing protein
VKTRRRRPARGQGGFTLIEVLVAMIILAVGLLALEGLAIGASRRVATANRMTEFTLIASEELETTLEQVRKGQNPASGNRELANGTAIARVVGSAPVAGRQLWTVSVTVTPPPAVTLNLSPITVNGRALR